MPLHVKEMVSFVLHFLIYTTPCAFMVVLSISGAGRLFSPPPVSGPQTKLDRFLPCELRWLRLFFGFALIPLAFLGLVWLRDGYDRTVNPGCIVLFFL